MTADDFWARHHEEIEHKINAFQQGDPESHRDDLAAPMLWQTRQVSMIVFDIIKREGEDTDSTIREQLEGITGRLSDGNE